MQYSDYINFINKTIPISEQTEFAGQYTLSIPHAIVEGGNNSNINGSASTPFYTCNGGGGGAKDSSNISIGGIGCIFGQYAGGRRSNAAGYGYGSDKSNKYRCALVIIANGNITINGTITQNGGDGIDNGELNAYGGYGGGAYYEHIGFYGDIFYGVGGGGGAPVFYLLHRLIYKQWND